MRTAINTYQSGGVFYEPLPLTPAPTQPTPQASPVQPPPGAAGPTPTPSPPDEFGATTPSTLPTPTTPPPTAIDTKVQPPPLDVDKDLIPSLQAEDSVFGGKNIFSHRGDNRSLNFTVDKDDAVRRFQEHPDYQKTVEAAQLIKTLPEGKEKEKWKRWNDGEQKRIRTEVGKQLGDEHKKMLSDEKAELSKVDAIYQSPQQTAQWDELLKNSLATAQAQANKDLAIRDPKVQQQNQTAFNASAFNPKVMSQEQLLQVARNIMALNPRINSPDRALKIAMQIAAPVPPEQKSVNGYSGKGGAFYMPHGTDLIGNRFISLPEIGMVRIGKDELGYVREARVKGYVQMMKYQDDLKKQREEEAKPGLVGRTLKSLGLQ